jgi:hypothetical protein
MVQPALVGLEDGIDLSAVSSVTQIEQMHATKYVYCRCKMDQEFELDAVFIAGKSSTRTNPSEIHSIGNPHL